MKVSIITVSYNAAGTIEDTILSVLGQTYQDIEYIAIDGFSTDGTIDILKKYTNRITKIISEPDQGIYFAMNKGLELATGDLIGILNADDVYAGPDTIKNIVQKILETNSDALYGDLVYVKNNKISRYWRSKSFTNPNQFKYGWMPPHPTFFVKNSVYKKLGGFNTDFRFSSDYELMLRFLFGNKITCTYLPEIIVKMKVGGVSNKSIDNRLKANLEDKKAWRINNLSMPFYTSILKPLLKLTQFKI